jgi:transcriptional regulator with XRE-family HTH domain
MPSLLFPAVLKYWRGRRGLSQLELALEANVSARHLSFLESGRAKPSEEMVLRLLAVLTVPLRHQNEALLAAGFTARFDAPGVLSPAIDQALEQMMAQHEPFPLTVLTLDSTIVRSNRAAQLIFSAFVEQPEALPQPLDMFTLLLDPRLMRPFVLDWEALAHSMVSRLHRENLTRGGDERLVARLEHAFSFPGVRRSWSHPDFSRPAEPTLTVRAARGDRQIGFLVAATTFTAPQQVELEELRIESCFPLDARTRTLCEQLARQG